MRRLVPSKEPITIERLERGLLFMAYILDKYGEVYIPIFERIEREVELARAKRSTMDRARALLDSMPLALQQLRKQPDGEAPEPA